MYAKFVPILVLVYVVAFILYFIYSITHVSYTRKEFSKRDISDGPLVLKEDVRVVVDRGVGPVKKYKSKLTNLTKKASENQSVAAKVNAQQLELELEFVKVSENLLDVF
ncbi:hypothetical protein RB195_020462 [Necator americanus]|uniref:Uncharacterized protein n=1 Tax=Necator americanus TaxID=51031 RepID=A0ABR1CLQ2_NECAM